MTYYDLFLRATTRTPFPYQRALALADKLPEALSAPTGAGKTAAVVLGWLYRQHAEAALAFSQEHTQGGEEAWSLYLLGASNNGEETAALTLAEEHYRHGFARAAELAMRPVMAHCHLGLGKLYRRRGNVRQAQKHLTAATTMYREMGMQFCLEQAEAEMRELA